MAQLASAHSAPEPNLDTSALINKREIRLCPPTWPGGLYLLPTQLPGGISVHDSLHICSSNTSEHPGLRGNSLSSPRFQAYKGRNKVTEDRMEMQQGNLGKTAAYRSVQASRNKQKQPHQQRERQRYLAKDIKRSDEI